MTAPRRKTRTVQAGDLYFGSEYPVSVQTMWPESFGPGELSHVYRRMRILKEYGCGLIRFTIAGDDDIPLLSRIVQQQIMPVSADVHYNYRYALQALEAGAAKVRINPGTIGAMWKTREIIHAASDSGAAVRLGLNGGSLPREFKDSDPADGMLQAAEQYINVFEQEGFSNLVVSLKSSDVGSTLEANRKFSAQFDYPLHIGVTEAGPLIPSVVKSTYALAGLLEQGIGDTIRVSISDSMEKEIITAKEILKLLGLAPSGVTIISCPKCGRASFDTHRFLAKIEQRLYRMKSSITVACMGCAVNGIDEARHADLGITGVGNKVFLFRHGEIIREADPSEAEDAFLQELDAYE